MKTVHEQVYSHLIGASVDEGLLELLELLHFHNVETLFSCQGIEPDDKHPGHDGYIMMTKDALDFIVRLAKRLEWNVVRLPRNLEEESVIIVRFDGKRIPFMTEELHKIYDEGTCCAKKQHVQAQAS